MKRELEYFTIDGAYGGNQDWFKNLVMKMGGCAAATACDCSIYLALYEGMEELYPYNVRALTKQEYIDFSQKMKPYIRPRVGGVRRISWFIEGWGKYIQDRNEEVGKDFRKMQQKIQIDMAAFAGSHSYEEACKVIKRQIDGGYPVPYLLLQHTDRETFKDYIWHWFLLTGYEETEDDLLVKTATYGESDTFSLKEMWNTGCEEKGGLVQFTNIRYNN